MRKMAFSTLALTAAALALGLGSASPRAEEPDAPAGRPPLVTWWGPDSKVTERGIERVTTAEQWADVWARHTGATVRRSNIGQAFIPEVDFERCAVVVAFQGRGRNSNGLKATWEELEDQVRVRFDDRSYQTAGPGGGAVDVTAYGLFVIPRSGRPLVVEENVQNIIGAAPIWRERARFPGAE